MDKSSPILIIGHGDVIERSLCDVLRREGFASVLSSSERSLPLFEKPQLQKFFEAERPAQVIVTSVRSGGSVPIGHIRPSSSVRTWKSRPMSLILRTGTG